MKGKYRKKKKSNRLVKWLLFIVILLVVIIAAMVIHILNRGDDTALGTQPLTQDTQDTEMQTPADNAVHEDATGDAMLTTEVIDLGQGLQINSIAHYTGIYMEDGSDEVVSDIMMLILENTSEQDLQLARINITYTDFTAEFEVTNLPAGASAVLLEKNRHSAVTESYQTVETKNVLFFQEPMGLMEDQLRISGMDGAINVTNISEEDISGDIFIYYKNSATDLFYGGITYRIRIEGGLAAGETAQIISERYSPESCTFLMADCGE